jgi:hypothetical protein
MIVVALTGGLGNQLFQYATARALALRRGASLGLDRRWYEGGRGDRHYALDSFAISASPFDRGSLPFRDDKILGRLLAGRGGRFRIFHERGLTFDPSVLDLADGTYLSGVFQSEGYFADQETLLRRDLSFVTATDDANRAILAEISHRLSVSLHIRRGDYASNPRIAAVHGTLRQDYYARAADLVAERAGGDPAFFVFSDDPPWVADHLHIGFPLRILDHNPGTRAADDLRLMAACSHHILANSSFSWWGAWLNPRADKIVVAPKPWFRDPSLDDSTIVPDRWLRVQA